MAYPTFMVGVFHAFTIYWTNTDPENFGKSPRGPKKGYGPWAMTKTAKELGEKQNMIYELFMVIY